LGGEPRIQNVDAVGDGRATVGLTAVNAANFIQTSVEIDYSERPGFVVQGVNVLGDHPREVLALLCPGNSAMTGVWLRTGETSPT
jgi:hypothetical protein